MKGKMAFILKKISGYTDFTQSYSHTHIPTSTKFSSSEYFMAQVQFPIFLAPYLQLVPLLHLNEITHLAFYAH